MSYLSYISDQDLRNAVQIVIDCMIATQQKQAEEMYHNVIDPYEILRRIAYEENCNLSGVLDVVLEQVNWQQVAKGASNKPVHRVMERGGQYKV